MGGEGGVDRRDRRGAGLRRTLSVTLLSFSSGLPLGLVWYAIPDWMTSAGIDIRVVGLTTLVHLPWTFKVLWSPLMDRYAPPWLGPRRGWVAATQIALSILTLLFAGLGDEPGFPSLILALSLTLAFASASQDIALDAYAVEILHRREQGVAVGARIALYRVAMMFAGAFAITIAGRTSWPTVFVLLALTYLPLLAVTRFAPEPEERIVRPASLVEAVWKPLADIVRRPRAIEILLFVVLYKLADNLAQSMQRPFLNQMGYDSDARGAALGVVGMLATLGGTFVGGALTTPLGLGRCLWIFGVLQIFSNLGFVVVSQRPVDVPLMLGAMAFESFTTGLGMGAFGVLLLRLTAKRFSATQYAVFSSLFALPRMLAGPVTGVVVDALGWTAFFWLTILAGIPGLVMLARFVPPLARETRAVAGDGDDGL